MTYTTSNGVNKNLIASIIIGIEGILFFMFLVPKYRELSGTYKMLEERNKLLVDVRIAQERISVLTSEYNSRGDLAKRIITTLPVSEQYDYLTENFQAAARDSGMQLISLSIGKTGKTSSKEEYKAIPLNAELKGEYSNFLRFLDAIEHSIRLYDILRLSLSSGSTGGQNADSLSIKMEANAYSLKK